MDEFSKRHETVWHAVDPSRLGLTPQEFTKRTQAAWDGGDIGTVTLEAVQRKLAQAARDVGLHAVHFTGDNAKAIAEVSALLATGTGI